MTRGVTASGKEYTVTNIDANGKVIDDSNGIFVPVNEYTVIGYRMLIESAKKRWREEISKQPDV